MSTLKVDAYSPAGSVRTMYVHCTYIVPTVSTMYVHCTYTARWEGVCTSMLYLVYYLLIRSRLLENLNQQLLQINGALGICYLHMRFFHNLRIN